MGLLDVFGAGDTAKAIASITGRILDYFPNATQRAEAQKHLEDLVAAAQAQQVEVNKTEAATGSLFLAGWRPFIAWNCGFIFVLNLWLILLGFSGLNAELATQTIYLLLGLTGARSAEKLGGVATDAIRKIFKK